MDIYETRFGSNLREGGFPFEAFGEGRLRPKNKMSRYLKQGAAGEVSLATRLVQSDLPGRADSKVALDRRGRPSSKAHLSKLRMEDRVKSTVHVDLAPRTPFGVRF